MAETAPALGYSIVANLGDNRQMTVQCFVDSDAPLADQNAAIDKAMAVVDRQRARHEIKDHEVEREKHAESLRRLEEDLEALETSYRQTVEREKTYLGNLSAEIKNINETAHGSGRQGPVGAAKARVTAIKAEQKEIAEKREKDEAERQVALKNYATSADRFKQAIADLDKKIEAARALIGEGG